MARWEQPKQHKRRASVPWATASMASTSAATLVDNIDARAVAGAMGAQTDEDIRVVLELLIEACQRELQTLSV